jgi:L-threonylcarbamoyladenylate synthase
MTITGTVATVPLADIISVEPSTPDRHVLVRAGEVIRRGGLVAFPTETVYGLGANALDDRAVARIYEAKRRDPRDPLIVHVADPSDLDQVAVGCPPSLLHLANRFWPGPLTIVVGRHPRVPDRVSAGRSTIAVRVPAHPVALGLIDAAGVPIAAPSANRFMRTSATLASHVQADLGDAIDLILDGGPTDIGLESTVTASDADGAIRILRPGAVPAEAIVAALREAGIDLPVFVGARREQRSLSPLPRGGEGVGGGGAPGREAAGAFALDEGSSPGLLDTHYAPRARLVLVSGPPIDAVAAIARQVTEATRAEHERVGLLVYDDDVSGLSEAGAMVSSVTVAHVGASSAPEAVAHRLFAALRDLDDAGVTIIIARTTSPVTIVPGGPPTPGGTGLSCAIDDRLIRAAGSRVIVSRALAPCPSPSATYKPATPAHEA